jgi:hypothetical protein
VAGRVGLLPKCADGVQFTSALNQPGAVMDKIVDYLLGQGLSGVIIICLGYVCHKLYNRNQELHNTLYEVGRESVKANQAMTAALHRLSDLLLHGRNSYHDTE